MCFRLQAIITRHGERTVRSRLSARRLVALPNLHAEPARSICTIIWVDAAMLRQLSSCAQVSHVTDLEVMLMPCKHLQPWNSNLVVW